MGLRLGFDRSGLSVTVVYCLFGYIALIEGLGHLWTVRCEYRAMRVMMIMVRVRIRVMRVRGDG